MSLFGFFKSEDKKEIIHAIQERKLELLQTVHSLFVEEMQFKDLDNFEGQLLTSVENLDTREKSAVRKVLSEERTEDHIIDYLASIERQVEQLVESGDVVAIKTRLKKYIHVINELALRVERMEMTEEIQIEQIEKHEEKLPNKGHKREAVSILKRGICKETSNHKVVKRRFFKSLKILKITSKILLKLLFKLTVIGFKVGKFGVKTGMEIGKEYSDKRRKNQYAFVR